MEAFTIIHHVFPACLVDRFLGRSQLLQGGQGCLVGKVILPGVHHSNAQGATLAGDGRAAYQLHLRIAKDLLLALRSLYLGEGLHKTLYLFGIWVIHPFQRCPGLGQPVAHPVDMSVVQTHRRNDEFLRFYHRGGLALGGVIHTVFFLFHHSNPPIM